MPLITRRAALQTVAAALPALPALGIGRQMFLSLNSVLVNNRVPWPQFATLASAVGFPGVDIALDAAMKEGTAETKTLLKQLHLKPAAINFPVEFRKDDGTFNTGLAALDEQARFASDIGCPRMVTYIMASSNTPKAQLRALYLERFKASAGVLRKRHVRLALEFLGPVQFRKNKYEFIWRMNEMLEFAKEIGPNVGLLLDSWHWHHAGATVEDIIAAGRDRIVHVHFNDAPDMDPEQIRDNQRLLPGEGVINLTGFLQALQKIGYSDALSVEVFGRLNSEIPDNAARKGLEASLAVFRKAGVQQG